MRKKICILIIAICWSCNNSSDTEKYQNKRDNIISVKEKIKELEFEGVMIGQFAHLCIINDYLLISDPRSVDEQIYIFNKNNFNYITNTAYRGQGPGEIATMGFVGVNEADNIFYVTDHGKQKIFSYSLDSILTNPSYMPEVKMVMDMVSFPDKYQYINDMLFAGVVIEPTGNLGYNHSVAKINTHTGEISRMPYKHPEIERKRVCFAMSAKHGIQVECYHYHDLMTVCSLNGDLKYNIYGRKWNDRVTNKFGYYENVVFCNDKIVVSYFDGKDRYSSSESGYPTQFLVFDTKGDYIRTLETGYSILDFCYDKENNRIIMSLDAEIQFAYLDLARLVEGGSMI